VPSQSSLSHLLLAVNERAPRRKIGTRPRLRSPRRTAEVPHVSRRRMAKNAGFLRRSTSHCRRGRKNGGSAGHQLDDPAARHHGSFMRSQTPRPNPGQRRRNELEPQHRPTRTGQRRHRHPRPNPFTKNPRASIHCEQRRGQEDNTGSFGARPIP
jgi:hypothetical protein